MAGSLVQLLFGWFKFFSASQLDRGQSDWIEDQYQSNWLFLLSLPLKLLGTEGEDGEVTAVHLLLSIWANQDSAGHKVLAKLGFDDQKAMELAKLANGGDAVMIFR
ncbi:hypothetical protein ACLOJK_005343 [Asimina triloba]